MVPSILLNPLLSLGDPRGVWESAVESLTQRDGETWGHSGELPVAFGSFRTAGEQAQASPGVGETWSHQERGLL